MDTSGAIQQAFPWAEGQPMLCAPQTSAPALPALPAVFRVRLVNVSGEFARDKYEMFPTLREARDRADEVNRNSANWHAEVTA